jgi:uncharacterized protein
MIAIDTNLLVYAHRRDSAHHDATVAELTPIFNDANPWALAWHSVHEFISVVTHPGIYKPASKLEDAILFIETLFSSPHLHLLAETAGYFPTLKQIAAAAKVRGPRIYDARIAALCLRHGVTEFWTADRDFSAFPQLKTRNPLKRK